MVYFLHSWSINNQEKVEVSVKEFFASKDKNWYRCGIKELTQKCFRKCNIMASTLNAKLFLL